ncbi:hypothetical protein E5288_WYG007817 [Bos mutus]|uniref:Uncharacterized protein n=1 Tax=Bos mutus TaxID=72004 RepID=A0A6B0RP32_9CETA|nr:hypothetical protein [Bos mutus]
MGAAGVPGAGALKALERAWRSSKKGPSAFQSSLRFGAMELSRPVAVSVSVSVSPWCCKRVSIPTVVSVSTSRQCGECVSILVVVSMSVSDPRGDERVSVCVPMVVSVSVSVSPWCSTRYPVVAHILILIGGHREVLIKEKF